MSPEQLAGKEVTVRSDIYSLGLVLYEILTGKRPFEASTLAELIHVRTKTVPPSPSTLVRDLDPMVERVILRCLEPEPSRRPASALAVAAALPGGGPLAAALAAGETPSPEMVAASGEVDRTCPAHRHPSIHRSDPRSDRSLCTGESRQCARGDPSGVFSRSAVTEGQGCDPAARVSWPSLLRFWYRESPYPLTGTEFHDELLTPGIVEPDDPPLTMSGMILVDLDSQGRLTKFQAIPDQVQPALQGAGKQIAPVDWNVLFAAAGLDQAKFQSAEPLWTWLAASDTRMAWTGTWPGTARPLRVEAAAWRGRPVAFSLIGPWTKPDRMPPQESSAQERAHTIFAVGIAVVMIFGGALLARRNLLRGSGDHPGALRLGAAMFGIHCALWICRAHLAWSIGTFGTSLVAMCTSLAWGAVIWTMYVALEPFVRRHWPRTIISWTSVLTARVRDPIVGRDVLFGAACGVALRLIDRFFDLPIWGSTPSPGLGSTALLVGARSTLGAWLMRVPYGVRGTLIFFFFIFLLRVLLRNEWFAAATFVLIFTCFAAIGSSRPIVAALANLIAYTIVAVVVLRFGLLTLAVGIFVNDLLVIVPATWQPSAWYFGSTIFVLASIVALATWALHTSIAGRRFWNQDLFS